jgi:hypothetical protein
VRRSAILRSKKPLVRWSGERTSITFTGEILARSHRESRSKRFDVWRTDIAEDSIHGLRADVRSAVEQIEEELAYEGCRAAGYRLTGHPVHHLCARHIKGLRQPWRVLIGFPTLEEIAILLVERHDRIRNVYLRVYEVLGVQEPSGERTKPPCCDQAGAPPLDSALVRVFETAVSQ